MSLENPDTERKLCRDCVYKEYKKCTKVIDIVTGEPKLSCVSHRKPLTFMEYIFKSRCGKNGRWFSSIYDLYSEKVIEEARKREVNVDILDAALKTAERYGIKPYSTDFENAFEDAQYKGLSLENWLSILAVKHAKFDKIEENRKKIEKYKAMDKLGFDIAYGIFMMNELQKKKEEDSLNTQAEAEIKE